MAWFVSHLLFVRLSIVRRSPKYRTATASRHICCLCVCLLLGHFQLCGGFLLRVSPHGAPRYAGLPPTDTPHTVQLQFLPLPFPHRQRGLWLFRSGARFLCVSFHLRTEDAPRGVPFKATPLQCFVGGLLGGRSDAARSRRHVDGGRLSLF